MFIRRLTLGRWTLFLGLLCAGVTSHGLEPKDLMAFGVGPFVARPHLTVSEQYDDNIFYMSGGAIDDFITTVGPGLDVRLGKGGGRGTLDLAYTFSALFYASNPYIRDATQHQVTLLGGWQGNKLSLTLTGSLGWSDTIFGGYQAFILGWNGTNFVIEPTTKSQRIARTTYSAVPLVSYALSDKFSGYVTVPFNATKFQPDASFYNVNTWRTTLGVDYAFRLKLRVLGEAYYGQDAADPNADLHKYAHMSTIGGMVGLRGDLSRKINATLKAGYQENAHGSESFGAPVFSLSLAAQLSEKSSLSVTYSRNSSLSIQAASAYVSDSFGARYSRTLGTKKPWIVGLAATYGMNDYRTGGFNGSTDYFSADASLSYQLKLWLRTSLAYQYAKSWSGSKSTIDYDDNRVTLSVSIGY